MIENLDREDGNLTSLLASVFETTTDQIKEDTVQDDLPKWDSLRQIILVNVLEQNYNISIPSADMSRLVSVKAIRTYLDQRFAMADAGADEPAPVVAPTSSVTLDNLRGQSDGKVTLQRIYESADLIRSDEVRQSWQGDTVRVAVLGDLTVDLTVAAIAFAVFQENALPEIYTAPYGALVQEIIDPRSKLHRFDPDVVVLAPDWREHIAELPITASQDDVDLLLHQKVTQFQSLWEQLLASGPKRIIQHLIVPSARQFRGLAERLAPASPGNQVAALNRMMIAAAAERVQWIETDSLAQTIGLSRWSSERHYQASRLPFDPVFLPEYTACFRAAWRTGAAKGKKVLALDLDNTLWGGVIGDDGVEGIRLGSGSPEGEAFAEWGRYIKQLAGRGVILAVCSKNDAALAATGFDHPQSPLVLDDFAATEISWDDKASGLTRLAARLNVGIDSFVFADDNPFECDLVRQNLPEVGVVELGTEPSAFIDILERGHWFDTPFYTQEDFGRAKAYKARSAAESERSSASDIGSYLKGLQMEARIDDAQAEDFPRLSQMEKKTNQFNVTTRRLSAEQLETFATRDDAMVLACALKDRHADHGLVSSLVAVREGDAYRIDSWLMSCRVFSRGFEDHILNALAVRARAADAVKIVGEYLPTAKNVVVADLYERLGFAAQDDEGRFWELALSESAAGERLTYISGAVNQDTVKNSFSSDKVSPEPNTDLADLTYEDLIAAAQKASAQGAAGTAARFWKEAVRRDPLAADAHIYLIEAYRNLRQFDLADAAIERGRELHPDHPGIFFQYAARAESSAEWEEARDRWQQALERFPTYPEPRFGLGIANQYLGQGELALEWYAENFKIFPHHQLTALAYADALEKQGKWHAAAEMLSVAQIHISGSAEIAIRLVTALVRAEATDEARERIDAATAQFPEDERIHEFRTWVLSAQHDWQGALQQAEISLAKPGYQPFSVDLARIARQKLGQVRPKTIVIYGNCQAAVLTGFTRQLRALYDDFEVFEILGHDPSQQAKLSDPALENCTLYWEQYDERPSVPMRDALRDRVGAGCQRLVYPSLSMFSLWPFNWPDARNVIEPPRFPFGRYPHDGDAVAMDVAKEGLRGQEAFARYMELSKARLHNLSGQFERDVEQMRRRDSYSDVKMTDYVLNNYKKWQLFFTWGHVSGEAIKEIASQLYSKSANILGADLSSLEDNLRLLPVGVDDFWMPIHPDVAAWHKLDFAQDENARYNIYGNRWTFEEFMIRYIEYDMSW